MRSQYDPETPFPNADRISPIPKTGAEHIELYADLLRRLDHIRALPRLDKRDASELEGLHAQMLRLEQMTAKFTLFGEHQSGKHADQTAYLRRETEDALIALEDKYGITHEEPESSEPQPEI